MNTRDNIFAELAATLKLRRNLESAMTPPEVIGCRDRAKEYETEAAFHERRQNYRRNHADDSRKLLEAHKLSVADVPAKIHELRVSEAALWEKLNR